MGLSQSRWRLNCLICLISFWRKPRISAEVFDFRKSLEIKRGAGDTFDARRGFAFDIFDIFFYKTRDVRRVFDFQN